MKRVLFTLLTAIFIAPLTVLGQSHTVWQVDPAHTDVEFTVTHMGMFDVTGTFTEFSGELITNGQDLQDAKANATIQVNSIDTDNGDRDAHLKSDDFFAAAEHPELTFVSKKMTKVGDQKYQLTGDITIRGTTQPITLDVEYKGRITDMFGNDRMGFTATGTLNRKDFGLKWSEMTEGVAVVSDQVRLTIKAQLINKSQQEQAQAEK
jgi:polyisoprenoid-binding protein YceI